MDTPRMTTNQVLRAADGALRRIRIEQGPHGGIQLPFRFLRRNGTNSWLAVYEPIPPEPDGDLFVFVDDGTGSTQIVAP